MSILIPILGITAGIVAIISSAYVKVRKIELQKTLNGQNNHDKKYLEDKIQTLTFENTDLRKRITNLESIVASKEWEFLLPPHSENLSNQEKANILAKKL